MSTLDRLKEAAHRLRATEEEGSLPEHEQAEADLWSAAIAYSRSPDEVAGQMPSAAGLGYRASPELVAHAAGSHDLISSGWTCSGPGAWSHPDFNDGEGRTFEEARDAQALWDATMKPQAAPSSDPPRLNRRCRCGGKGRCSWCVASAADSSDPMPMPGKVQCAACGGYRTTIENDPRLGIFTKCEDCTEEDCPGTPGAASWGRCEKQHGHEPPCTHDPAPFVPAVSGKCSDCGETSSLDSFGECLDFEACHARQTVSEGHTSESNLPPVELKSVYRSQLESVLSGMTTRSDLESGMLADRIIVWARKRLGFVDGLFTEAHPEGCDCCTCDEPALHKLRNCSLCNPEHDWKFVFGTYPTPVGGSKDTFFQCTRCNLVKHDYEYDDGKKSPNYPMFHRNGVTVADMGCARFRRENHNPR